MPVSDRLERWTSGREQGKWGWDSRGRQKEENQKADKKAVSVRQGHECIGVPKHILGSRLMDRLAGFELIIIGAFQVITGAV